MEALDPQKKKNVSPNGSRDPKATLLEFTSGRLQEFKKKNDDGRC